MINYTEIAIEKFCNNVDSVFISLENKNEDVISVVKQMGRIAFSCYSRSDSLYFSLEHAVKSGNIGLELIYAINSKTGIVRNGTIINLMASILFCNVGIVKGILSGDKIGRYLVNDSEHVKTSDNGTGSELWPYRVFRSKKFLKDCSYLSAELNDEIVDGSIEYSDLFDTGCNNKKHYGLVQQYCRAVQFITLMSADNYRRAITELFYSAQEGKVLDSELYNSLGEFRNKFPQYFWNTLFPDIAETVIVLRETDRGRDIVSNIYAHL